MSPYRQSYTCSNLQQRICAFVLPLPVDKPYNTASGGRPQHHVQANEGLSQDRGVGVQLPRIMSSWISSTPLRILHLSLQMQLPQELQHHQALPLGLARPRQRPPHYLRPGHKASRVEHTKNGQANFVSTSARPLTARAGRANESFAQDARDRITKAALVTALRAPPGHKICSLTLQR